MMQRFVLSSHLTDHQGARYCTLAEIYKAEIDVMTPYAIATPTIFPASPTGFIAVKHFLKRGWTLHAWDYSSHGRRGDDKTNYWISLMGKEFPRNIPLPFTAKFSHPPCYCSNRWLKTFDDLKDNQGDQNGGCNGGWLRLYYGDPLNPEQAKWATAHHWRRLPCTDLWTLGYKPEELPASARTSLEL